MNKGLRLVYPYRPEAKIKLKIVSFFLVSFLVLPTLSGARIQKVAAITENNPGKTGVSLDSEELAFFVLINDYRRQNGLESLSLSPTLTLASHEHSLDMAAYDYFSHDSLDGRTLADRVLDAGYIYQTPVGENLAAGYPTAIEAFEAWKASPDHNVNMLFGRFKVIGVGRVPDSARYYYWTTDFGGFVDSIAKRLYGQTSSETAIAVSQKGWPNGSKVAIIARDDYFADALAGGPLAKYVTYKYGKQAPILLSDPHKLTEKTREEIQRLGVEKIYVIGGEGAVDNNVANQLDAIPGATVERLWGQTAYGTALAIKGEMVLISAQSGAAPPNTAIITTGENFPDSLVISGPAASKNMPILLVKPFSEEPEPETKLALQGIKSVIIVGGPGAVHPQLENWLRANKYNVLTRLWGLSEYDTAIDVASSGNSIFNFNKQTTLVTRGDYFTDALAGGAYASQGPYPMILVNTDFIPQITNLWFQGYKDQIDTVYILGGWGAVSDGVMGKIESSFL